MSEGGSERSSHKAKREKHPVPWRDEGALEAWLGLWGDTSEGQGGRTWEQRKETWGSALLLNSWNGMGRRDEGAHGATWPTVSSAGMWSFLWVREEMASFMREQGRT